MFYNKLLIQNDTNTKCIMFQYLTHLHFYISLQISSFTFLPEQWLDLKEYFTKKIIFSHNFDIVNKTVKHVLQENTISAFFTLLLNVTFN